jgi:hypothetical protein
VANHNCKKYTLDDGTVTDAKEVAKRVGITTKNARSRLSIHTDPIKVFKPKLNRNKENMDSYKMRKIMKRGMFDEMLVLAMESI